MGSFRKVLVSMGRGPGGRSNSALPRKPSARCTFDSCLSNWLGRRYHRRLSGFCDRLCCLPFRSAHPSAPGSTGRVQGSGPGCVSTLLSRFGWWWPWLPSFGRRMSGFAVIGGHGCFLRVLPLFPTVGNKGASAVLVRRVQVITESPAFRLTSVKRFPARAPGPLRLPRRVGSRRRSYARRSLVVVVTSWMR